ncbi:MAG TPA: hypothetical protein VNX40_11360 [Mucilaginibacter sp.]|jgi:hypothetical protein|nr:hypothetical protein [Mucilaginibacter sp.]
MGTIQDLIDSLDNNRDRILLTYSIGEDLVKKLDDAGATYKVNDDGSVNFENCPEELLEEIRQAKKK